MEEAERRFTRNGKMIDVGHRLDSMLVELLVATSAMTLLAEVAAMDPWVALTCVVFRICFHQLTEALGMQHEEEKS